MTTTATTDDRASGLLVRLAEARTEQPTGSLADTLQRLIGKRRSEQRGLIELIEAMVSADERLRVVAPSISSLLRAGLIAQDVTTALAGDPTIVADSEDRLAPDDVLRMARVRGEAEAGILQRPMYEGPALARLLGSSSHNTREFASSVRRRGDVVALPHGNRYVFPAFQVNPARGEVWPIVAEINRTLGAVDNPWAAASFWFTPDSYLGRAPADLVSEPLRAGDLRLAAQRALAPID